MKIIIQSFTILLICTFVLNMQFLSKIKQNAGDIIKVSTLSEVQDSGDHYPQFVPKVLNAQLFENKKILFTLSHGTEDHEVYYQHQYFTDRGAEVEFACAGNGLNIPKVIISDFFKPSYELNCKDIQHVDFYQYDAIFIAGGLPSSAGLVASDAFNSKIKQFWQNKRFTNKLIAAICSGTETLILPGILDNLPGEGNMVGSPASTQSFYAFLDNKGISRDKFKGNDPNVNAISYPSDGNHPNLILGKNPMASPEFTVQISKVWGGIDEQVPHDATDGKPLNMVDNKYNHPDFKVLKGDLNLMHIPHNENEVEYNIPENIEWQDKKIGIAVGSGVNYYDILYLQKFFAKYSADITYICPAWIPIYKEGKVFLFSNPPTTAFGYLKCDIGFDKVKSGENKFDSLIVPGGLFSTNGVLRNDGDLNTSLYDYYNSGKPVIFLDSGIDLAFSGHISSHTHLVPKVKPIQHDQLNEFEGFSRRSVVNIWTLKTKVVYSANDK